ncbi:MAG: ATP-binding protein [Actinobacteria bacterium]|nr:ATP-binding protein [Actinomycetota bacterium]
MPIPTIAMVNNLRFTDSGTVWADYLVRGISYGLRPEKEKRAVRQLHQALVRALGGESLLLGLASIADPQQLVAKMLEGLDPETCPDWVAECQATLSSLEQIHPGQRIFWLSVPLANTTPLAAAATYTRTATWRLKSRLGMPRQAPTAKLVAELTTIAAKTVESVPASFRIQPATPAQMVWLHQHMLDRGLFQDWNLPGPSNDQVTVAVATSKTGTAMVEPFLDEGGQTDLNKTERLTVNPFTRRFLKVQDPSTGVDEASYQSLLVISDVPDNGIPFPGGELIGRIDECGIAVDWAMRLHVRSAQDVMVENKRALAALNEQMLQRDGEMSHAVSALDRYAELQSEYASIFESDKLEVEAQATMILCCAGPDAETASVQSKALAGWISEWGYRAVAPLGHQETMWWAMVPGHAADQFVREYAQITTSTDLAALCPLATVEIGDAKGSILAINIGHGPMLADGVTCGPSSVVYHDPDGATDRNESGSIAVSGDLGSGKSFTLKTVAGDVLDRGGRIIVPDRTEMGEWAQWARSITQAKIVDVVNPDLSLDPLRLFGIGVGSRMALSFLTPLLNFAPTSDQGVLLADVLDPTYLTAHQLDSMGDLVSHLAGDCELEGARDVARKINVYARQGLCRVIFDATLPAIALSDRAVIILTHSLELPTNEELVTEHLFAQLSVEKIFGRALYAFIAALAERVCFEDPDTLAAFVVDEAHFITSSSEGVRVVTRFVRDGRKHRAIIALGSQDAIEDFPSDVLRGLIPTRILMRHTDKTLARRGLQWLGQDPDDEMLVDLVTKDLSPKIGDSVPNWRRGEGLMRDAAGNIGRVKVMGPALAARNQAARTGGKRDLVEAR